MRHRGVEREDRQASDGRVLPRHSGEHHDVPCAKTAGQHAGGADDAFPDDGRLERRVLLGVGARKRVNGSYNLPSNRVLKKEGEHFSLTVPFSTPIEKVDVQELSVRVILPECVKNVQFVLPEGVEQEPMQKRFTYLDSSFQGRPVYEFKKRNLIDLQKEETITVTYDLNQMMLWREPLMCIGGFAVIFFLKAVIRWMTWRNEDKEKRD